MADKDETVSDDIGEEVAATVAPAAVAEAPQELYTAISRLENLVDRMTEVVERAPETAAEHHPEQVAETAQDSIPIRKPWTHRVPFQRHSE